MNPELLKTLVTQRTRAVIPVHLNGEPCEMDTIKEFCEENKLVLIEDCAQAIGAKYKGQSVGSFGIGAFSMHPLKIFSACGDAGFLTINNEEDAERLRILRNLGLIDRDNCGFISSNSRLDTIQAAILLVKIKYLNEWITARLSHAQAYREAFTGKVKFAKKNSEQQGVCSTFVIRHSQRDRLLARLKKRGIDAKIHYPRAIHQHQAYAHLGVPSLPVTEKVVTEIISLPVSQELSVEDRDVIIKVVHQELKEIHDEL